MILIIIYENRTKLPQTSETVSEFGSSISPFNNTTLFPSAEVTITDSFILYGKLGPTKLHKKPLLFYCCPEAISSSHNRNLCFHCHALSILKYLK